MDVIGFISAPGPLELIVILVVALIVLGPKKLPEAARSVGRGMREFKESVQGISDYDDELDDDRPGVQAGPLAAATRRSRTRACPRPRAARSSSSRRPS